MLPLGIAWLAGVSLALVLLPPPPDPIFFAALLALAALCAWRMRGVLLAVLLLGSAVGLSLAELRLQQRMPDTAGRVDRIVTGVIDEFPRVDDLRCRFRFRVREVEDEGPPLDRILVSWYDCHEPPLAGETGGSRCGCALHAGFTTRVDSISNSGRFGKTSTLRDTCATNFRRNDWPAAKRARGCCACAPPWWPGLMAGLRAIRGCATSLP